MGLFSGIKKWAGPIGTAVGSIWGPGGAAVGGAIGGAISGSGGGGGNDFSAPVGDSDGFDWRDIVGIAGDVWEWFEDSDLAQDALGAILQQVLWDKPEIDYDKIAELAIKQAIIDSPDQFTPTMTSEWDVDPETGKRTQNLQYRPEFQGLLDMLVSRAGSPKETYRAPEGMTTDLLGSRMNHLLGQSGIEPREHQRFQFPEYSYAPTPSLPTNGVGSTGDPDDEMDEGQGAAGLPGRLNDGSGDDESVIARLMAQGLSREQALALSRWRSPFAQFRMP